MAAHDAGRPRKAGAVITMHPHTSSTAAAPLLRRPAVGKDAINELIDAALSRGCVFAIDEHGAMRTFESLTDKRQAAAAQALRIAVDQSFGNVSWPGVRSGRDVLRDIVAERGEIVLVPELMNGTDDVELREWTVLAAPGRSPFASAGRV